MIRVLHYGMSPNLGGIETYLLNLARTADPDRFHFDFLYTDLAQLPVFASELPDSKFYGVTPRRVSPRRNRQDLDRLFADEQFDILHFHANTASYVEPVKAALRHGVKVVYHSHNAGASRSRRTRVLHQWNRRTLPWHRITKVAVSREAGRWMFGSRPFEVIHNGIDVDAFGFRPEARQRVREELGITPDALVVGSIAAFLPAKNHGFLLRVFGEVARQIPSARLLLVGDGPLEAQVRQQVRDLGLDQAVLFLGRRPDVPDLLSAMDVLLFPSLHEGLPLATIEAQASGLRCLLADTITPEVGVTPQCRYLPLSASAKTWAQLLLTADHMLDRSAGRYAVAARGFSHSAAVRAVEALYQQMRTPR